jgi:hypothetical protein
MTEAEKTAQEVYDRVRTMPDRPAASDLHAVQQLINKLIVELRKDQDLRKWCVEQTDDFDKAMEIYKFVTDSVTKTIVKLGI